MLKLFVIGISLAAGLVQAQPPADVICHHSAHFHMVIETDAFSNGKGARFANVVE